MTHPERTVISIPEHKLTGLALLGSDENDRVRAEKVELKDGTTQYSVIGRVRMSRSAIASVMATPLHYSDESWQDVRDGLRDVGYPSKQVRRASGNSQKRAHLKRVGAASKELADILTNNQPFRTQSINIPAFTINEALDYTNQELLKRTRAEKLLTMLKSIGVDDKTARQITEFVHFSKKSDETTKELQLLTGMTEQDILEAENTAIFEKVDRRIWVELVYRKQEEMFVGFLKEAAYRDNRLQFGGQDPAAFILEEDVPKNILASTQGTSVSVGRQLRDPVRETEATRYEVSFLTHGAEVVALPRLSWEKTEEGRRFAFPTSGYDKSDGNVVGRPSSILGAALAANYGRLRHGISYSSVLNNRLFPRKSWNSSNWFVRTSHGAGMLPLVINHHEATILNDDYFAAAEDALE